jgi:surfactin synthase thioesterase subunit
MRDKRYKIIALPFAGGSKYSYNILEKHIPSNVDWVTLDYPGRGSRFKESLLESVEEIVDDLLSKVIPLIQNDNYMIYGHSMGTLIGYELAKKIIQKNFKSPMGLFFTGRGAPGFDKFEEKKSLLPKSVFLEKINEIGGLPKEILEHEELMELYYPIIKSDFKAVENYEFLPMKKPFFIDMHICMGTKEIGEQKDKTPLASLKAWEKETYSSCSFELIEGGHFFIFRNSKIMAQKICSFAMKVNKPNP